MKLLSRCNYLNYIAFFYRPTTVCNNGCLTRNYITITSSKGRQLRYPKRFSFLSCLYSSDDKKPFLTLGKKSQTIKDAFEQKKEQFLDTEYRIRQKSEAIVRDIKQQKELTGQKLKVKKEHLIKDILETKVKIKEKIEEVVERENIYTVPNVLCVTRILMSPYLGYTIFQEQYHLALGLWVFAGITDVLDGWIARTWKGQSTKTGSLIDPLADKVLIATLFVSLTYQNLIPLPLTLLIVSRDLILVTAAAVVRYKSLPRPKTLSSFFDMTQATVQLAPTNISKFNTALQLLLVGTTLASPVFGYVDHPALQVLYGVTAASTVISALSYLFTKGTYKFSQNKS